MGGVVTVSVCLLLLQHLILSVYEQWHRYPIWLHAFKCDVLSSACNAGTCSNYEYDTLTFILGGAVENAEMLEINMSRFQTRVFFSFINHSKPLLKSISFWIKV